MEEAIRKNRIQVSNSKKSLFFYVNLSKRYLQQYNDVELSGLGMAISTVVSIAEILKNNGFATEKKIRTLTVDMRNDPGARPFPKAKIEILLGKSENFDELMAIEEEEEEGVMDSIDDGFAVVKAEEISVCEEEDKKGIFVLKNSATKLVKREEGVDIKVEAVHASLGE